MKFLPKRFDTVRVRTALGNAVAFVFCSTLLRILLATLFVPETRRPAGDVLRAFLVGFHLDLATAMVLTLPLGLRCLWGSRQPTQRAWNKALFSAAI